MAGYGHDSVTGLDERTLGRVDLLLYDADYRDAAAALEDSWRVALLAADPRLQDARERARVASVGAANRRRDPRAPRVRHATGAHRAGLAAAFVLAAVAAALATAAHESATVQQTLLPAGLCALASLVLLTWLEPLRAAGALWGTRVPSVLHIACALLWIAAAAWVFVSRWDEVDAAHALGPTTGLTLLVGCGVAALFLWRRARGADRAGGQSGTARLTAHLLDEQDAVAVLSDLDAWWAVAGPDALAADRGRVRRVRTEVLARLVLARIITAPQAQRAADAGPPARWRERRR